MSTRPLVSCIMPTADRRRYVALAIEYFLRQDYPAKELIVVDDGADRVADLMPEDERVRYFRLPERRTVGAKRNFACEQARGSVIAHWDDDDWHAPHRLSYQVNTMLEEGADVCGINVLLFYDAAEDRAWKYVYPPRQKKWLSGSSLCYPRAFWEANRFADINVGEDARFVWARHAGRMLALPDHTFHVGMVHAHNVSPKKTNGAYWSPHPVEEIHALLGDDLAFYRSGESHAPLAASAAASSPLIACVSTEAPRAAPVRNVYACLVHESQECVIDLVRNLRYHDPHSLIILYNGGGDAGLLNHAFPFERYGAVVHPSPRPMRWGWLHDFALDCMRFALDHFTFDTLTIVDSDQLGVRSGYSQFLGAFLSGERDGVGLLGNSPSVQTTTTRVAPAVQALKERELWRPFLRRFAGGEEKFVHWTFWPSTVFTTEAARGLVQLFDGDDALREIMSRSKIWATEEVIFPTLVSLLGHRVVANPCSYDYVKYRARYSPQQLNVAFARPEVFWVHPVARRYDDLLRKHIRARFEHYETRSGAHASPSAADERELLLTTPIIEQMKKVEGWLDEAEADLLIQTTARALTSVDTPPSIVEVGSYCGRATVVLGGVTRVVRPEAKIYSVDLHDGRLGALDQGIVNMPPSLEKFRRNVSAAGLDRVVELIRKRSYEVEWERPISLLLIDGLHDYANVARDFYHFERWVVEGGYVAFHDYAPYYPGVQAFVNEVLRSGRYRKVHCAGSMLVARKLPAADEAVRRETISLSGGHVEEMCAAGPARPEAVFAPGPLRLL